MELELPFTWQAVLTIGVLLGIVVALAKERARPDLIFLTGLAVLLVTGVLAPENAFAGFANDAIWIVGSLYVVAAGVQQTDLLSSIDRIFFSRFDSKAAGIIRLSVATASLSSVVNNTPVVAMLIPRVQEWARSTGFCPSRLLLPLSYAAIVGGMLTLVGSSTNIVVSGLLTASGGSPLRMFDITWVGLPVAAAVILYMAFIGHRFLPTRDIDLEQSSDGIRDYVFEFRVTQKSRMLGRTIDEAALRSLGNAYLIHIRREGRVIEASPAEVLRAGDILAFVGGAVALERLRRRSDLECVAPEASAEIETFPLYEAVVADTSNMIGRSLRDTQFREHYGGVVLAIHRRSDRIQGPIGRTPIREGDLLLVEARNGFAGRWKARRDEFYLVAPLNRMRSRPKPHKAPVAFLIVTTMVVAAASGAVPLTIVAFCAALAMIGTRCISSTEARRSINVQVLVVIASALGFGQALTTTGATTVLAKYLIVAAEPLGAVGILIALYVATNVLTELITNSAAAAIMLTTGLAAGAQLELPTVAIAVTVAIGASASFATPIGYQTNLMVMAAGRYRFADFTRVGFPAAIISMVVAVTSIYLMWVH